jgi:Rrf2 family protein
MELTTTTKYAIQILAFMAKQEYDKYSSKFISETLNIPYPYLTKIMTRLAKNSIIFSSKGKYGGFSIIKNLKDIRIIDIIIVFDDVNNKRCVLLDRDCNFEEKCILHDKWQKPRCEIDNFFVNTTLEELINSDGIGNL